MNILLVNDYLINEGGAEAIFFATKKILEENGHNVFLFGAKKRSKLPPILKGWFSIHYYLKARNIIDKFKPDIVHVHGCIREISPSPLLAAKQKKIPIVMTVHDFEIIGPEASMVIKKYKLLRKIKLIIQRYILRLTINYFICPSKMLTNWISESFKTNNVRYIPNFSILAESKKNDNDKFYGKFYLFVGRLYKEKGIEILINAFNVLFNKINIKEKIYLNIIGDGPQFIYLNNLIQKYKLQNNIKLLGSVNHKYLKNYYNNSIAVIIPSLWRENSSLVAYESMASGVPLIVSNTGGMPDLVEPNKNGYLFEMGDYKELANYLYYLYKNKKHQIKMGKYGYQKYLKDFTEDKYYTKIIDLYETLTNPNL